MNACERGANGRDWADCSQTGSQGDVVEGAVVTCWVPGRLALVVELLDSIAQQLNL